MVTNVLSSNSQQLNIDIQKLLPSRKLQEIRMEVVDHMSEEDFGKRWETCTRDEISVAGHVIIKGVYHTKTTQNFTLPCYIKVNIPTGWDSK